MKSIRTFILIAIGMLAFTGLAKTTANLEQKQKVELSIGVPTDTCQLQVVNMFSVFSNEVAVVKNVDFKNPFYTASIDVGLVSTKTILYTINTKLPQNSAIDYLRIQEQGYSQDNENSIQKKMLDIS